MTVRRDGERVRRHQLIAPHTCGRAADNDAREELERPQDDEHPEEEARPVPPCRDQRRDESTSPPEHRRPHQDCRRRHRSMNTRTNGPSAEYGSNVTANAAAAAAAVVCRRARRRRNPPAPEHAVGQLRGQPGRIKPSKIPPPQNLRQHPNASSHSMGNAADNALPPLPAPKTWPPRTEGGHGLAATSATAVPRLPTPAIATGGGFERSENLIAQRSLDEPERCGDRARSRPAERGPGT